MTIKEAIAAYLDNGGDFDFIDSLVDDARKEWIGIRVFHLTKDSLEAWEDAEPGWYWGEVDGWGITQGDSVGPFETEEDARADMENSSKK